MEDNITIDYTNFANPEQGIIKYLAEHINKLIAVEDKARLQQLVNDIAFVADALYDLNDEVEPKIEEYEQLKNKKEALEEAKRLQAEALAAIEDKLNRQFGIDSKKDNNQIDTVKGITGIDAKEPDNEEKIKPEDLLAELDAETIIDVEDNINLDDDIYEDLIFDDEIISTTEQLEEPQEDEDIPSVENLFESEDDLKNLTYNFSAPDLNETTKYQIPPSIMNNMGESSDPELLSNGMTHEELARQIYEKQMASMFENNNTTQPQQEILTPQATTPFTNLAPVSNTNEIAEMPSMVNTTNESSVTETEEPAPLLSADELFQLDDMNFGDDEEDSLSSQLGVDDEIFASMINDADDTVIATNTDDFYYDEDELSPKPIGFDEYDDDDDFDSGMLDDDLFN